MGYTAPSSLSLNVLRAVGVCEQKSFSAMSIVILTHPFFGNYGGMLQAYAMQKALACVDLDSSVCRYYDYPTLPFLKEVARRLLSGIREALACFIPRFARKKVSQIHFYRNGAQFLKRYMKSLSYEESCRSGRAWVVGSDQVWRAEYVTHWGGLPFFFLADVPADVRSKSIAYAASFGTEKWSGTEEDAKVCAPLLSEFRAVAVREHSGINICRDQLGVAAVQMPDPTMLLSTEDYNELIAKEKTWKPNSEYIAAYILDRTAAKDSLLAECSGMEQAEVQHLLPQATAKKRRDRYPVSVAQWLRLIRDSKYFVTDSFHGCVFAIIFNKPFVCLGNESRGSARFDSLLRAFGLQGRLAINSTAKQVQQILATPIDWEKVNHIRRAEQQRAVVFLKENLEL